MLKVERLEVFYDEVQALKGVSLEVNKGEVVTLIGANGAGKTTTLKTISGLVKPAAGQIYFEGKSITGLRPNEIVRLGIAHVPEGRRIFPQLTVDEDLTVGAHLIADLRRIRIVMGQVHELFPLLKERRNQLGHTLSGGEQQMLALGRAMMSQPRLLILDEPSLGLAPLIVLEVARSILQFGKLGIPILLVEQNAHLALALASRAYVMETGSITLSGTAAELRNNPNVVISYLSGPRENDKTLQPKRLRSNNGKQVG
jgi:branched-chain amino acid transport system ATP-binding protein